MLIQFKTGAWFDPLTVKQVVCGMRESPQLDTFSFFVDIRVVPACFDFENILEANSYRDEIASIINEEIKCK